MVGSDFEAYITTTMETWILRSVAKKFGRTWDKTSRDTWNINPENFSARNTAMVGWLHLEQH